jgi:hypothetical protein
MWVSRVEWEALRDRVRKLELNTEVDSTYGGVTMAQGITVTDAINLICNHLGVVLQREKCEPKTVLKIVEKP